MTSWLVDTSLAYEISLAVGKVISLGCLLLKDFDLKVVYTCSPGINFVYLSMLLLVSLSLCFIGATIRRPVQLAEHSIVRKLSVLSCDFYQEHEYQAEVGVQRGTYVT